MGAKAADSNIPFISQIEGEYQSNMAQAKATEADAAYNAAQRRKQGEQLMGEQVAAFGASGVELEGTPMAMIKNDQQEAEIEAMNIIYSGKMQAALMKRKASMAKSGAYLSLAKDGVMLAAGAGAFKGGGNTGTTTMKNGGAFDKASTGTGGYTMGENTSSYGIGNKGLA